ncbi:MAG: DegT/DnrJ/EryC1/StrS family aminotransferase [Candidatus Omnitrophica bacterium]|nr:DegT/DnrJ/EryC1/StrS family aminotransferase [Candidatus Omnitrophota bacterium]MDD5591950.1 DegT/DnrJ/EryC1/StrS family aminotransferase [Candidatus Omnitrophota bacterium]
MNKLPILDLKKQIAPIRRELDDAIKRIIDNTNFILGEEVRDFENAVQKYCKIKYAIGVSNGTDAIKLALLASGVKQKDKVLCPAFTYYATAGAIASMGAIPVFADIDPQTYNISVESIEKILKKDRRRKIKAIVPVHLYGQCADMDNILKIARKYKLKVIEDAAQSFGAEYLTCSGRQDKGKKSGTMGDCGCVSFFPGKNLGAFGDAGMVLTNSDIVAKRLKILRNQGNEDRYYHILLGFNNRMDTIHAAVLKIKLKYLDSWNRKRQENAEYLNANIKGSGIKIPSVPSYTTHIYHQYVLRMNSDSAKLIEHLRSKGIDSRVYYPLPLHLQKCFRYLKYKKGDFPQAEEASRETLAIPIYPDLTKEEMDYIITSIKEFFK